MRHRQKEIFHKLMDALEMSSGQLLVSFKDKIRVPIRVAPKGAYPISRLESLHAIALLLSYVGYRSTVIQLLQVLSHKTRSYICKQNELKGFLVEFDVIKLV